ncbi:MAG: hypothetical protein HN849_33555 [Victivallales bacterium]|nr:hypothetical protein [Victivallales bacterium]
MNTLTQTCWDLDLCGDWEFGYTTDLDSGSPALPDRKAFQATMPVPGYWDDHLGGLRPCAFWSGARFNPVHRPLDYPLGMDPPDASTPFLLGVGWYRRRFAAPAATIGGRTVLRIGGVKLEAWAWLNGQLVAHHLGHSTSFEIDLGPDLRPDAENELVIAVSNCRTDRLGCVIRGWKGFSAGITGPISLHGTGSIRLGDAFVHLGPDGQLHWETALVGELCDGLALAYTLTDSGTGEVLVQGTRQLDSTEASWSEAAPADLARWSDRTPALYRATLELRSGGRALDERQWSCGLRTFARREWDLLLNGQPVFLRGATEHGYYPETCTPPFEKAYYRHAIRRLKAVGFNWLRFHTSVPSEPYMAAADELGMLIQVEGPVGFGEAEWLDILRACRNHPSVVIYCCGNEECLDDETIERYAGLARLQKEWAPNALFNPHEALRGIEYCWQKTDFGERVVHTPYPHTPHRLARLKEFSDCFGQYAWGQLSYACTRADVSQLDGRTAPYERPLLSHENGIIGNYLDLALAWRYEGTRIGTGMFDSLRQNMAELGLLDRAAVYYKNSCAWHRLARKHNMETARRCSHVKGYDYLGGIDCHWHRVGYPCGVLNEFYELKPGDTEAGILRYNGESALLLGWDGSRNVGADTTLSLPVLGSIYGCPALDSATLNWSLATHDGERVAGGALDLGRVETGRTVQLTEVAAAFPQVASPRHLVFAVTLASPTRQLTNAWDFWVYPQAATDAEPACLVVEELGEEEVATLARGGSVLLLGNGPFPALGTSFQPSCAGRATGNLATVVADHPLLDPMDHEGWCDWQFAPLLEGGCAVLWDDLPMPFAPLLEVVSSFKTIRKQAAVFECRVGAGRLLVCGLRLPVDDAGAAWLRQALVRYASSDQFQPGPALPLAMLRELCGLEQSAVELLGTDQGFDDRAQIQTR